MQTWAKYALSFFALILILTGFIFAFGPASTRNAFESGETATGQLRADHQLTSPGEATSSAPASDTASGTSQPVPADAPGSMAQPQGNHGLSNTNGPTDPAGPGVDSSNKESVPAK